MASYRLTHAAEADLFDIARYTIENHGVEQAEKYKAGLLQGANTIAAMPRIGKEHVTSRGQRFRKFVVLHHVLFYQDRTDHVLIVRILHKRMDIDRHL